MEASSVLEPKDPEEKKKISTSLRLPVPMHREIEALATRLHMDMSEVAVYLLRRGLDLEYVEREGTMDVYKVLSAIRSLAARGMRLLTQRKRPPDA